jgi:hypothetical protein
MNVRNSTKLAISGPTTTHPQHYVDQDSDTTTPGLAAEAHAAVKAAKYADQDNFIPFILDGDRWTKRQPSGPRDWLGGGRKEGGGWEGQRKGIGGDLYPVLGRTRRPFRTIC